MACQSPNGIAVFAQNQTVIFLAEALTLHSQLCNILITKAGLSQLEFPLLLQILGAEFRQIIVFVKERGGG